MDFLGLRTLTVLGDAIDIIKHTQKCQINLDRLPLNDEKVYQMLSKGDTAGVFQLESAGMQNLLKELKPEVFEDVIAIIGLYRPGPLGSGAAEDFIKSKNGEKQINYLHPALKPILSGDLWYNIISRTSNEDCARASRLFSGSSRYTR